MCTDAPAPLARSAIRHSHDRPLRLRRICSIKRTRLRSNDDPLPKKPVWCFIRTRTPCRRMKKPTPLHAAFRNGWAVESTDEPRLSHRLFGSFESHRPSPWWKWNEPCVWKQKNRMNTPMSRTISSSTVRVCLCVCVCVCTGKHTPFFLPLEIRTIVAPIRT